MTLDIKKLVSILKEVLNGTLQASIARKQIKALSLDELGNVYANLFHYLDDEDIRNGDPRYKDFQNSEMKKLIKFLEVGDISKANEITFFSKTPNL